MTHEEAKKSIAEDHERIHGDALRYREMLAEGRYNGTRDYRGAMVCALSFLNHYASEMERDKRIQMAVSLCGMFKNFRIEEWDKIADSHFPGIETPA